MKHWFQASSVCNKQQQCKNITPQILLFISPEGHFATFRAQVSERVFEDLAPSFKLIFFSLTLFFFQLNKKPAPHFHCAAARRLVKARVQAELFSLPSAAAFTNKRSARSCWTKRTEEHLTAYRWHCITQNSFGLCYAHLSLLIHIWHGWVVILPEENWKRLCAALQYVLPSSLSMFLCSGEAAKQQPRE